MSASSETSNDSESYKKSITHDQCTLFYNDMNLKSEPLTKISE